MPHNRRNYNKTHSIALSGLLFALAMALSFIEGTLVIPGLLPGMKLGLANIVVMYALFFMGPKQALVLDVLKAFFVFLVSGWTAGFLSLCGGLLSLLVMWLLYYHCPLRPTWFILSVENIKWNVAIFFLLTPMYYTLCIRTILPNRQYSNP